MNTKLTTITTQYSKFSDNQVLTKGQLNQFLEYFEDQDHLSRISLSGVGIVCGFGVTYDSSKKEIYITKGYGVTTDGDLLALVEPKKPIEGQDVSPGFQLIQDAFKTYTHYRSFDDNNAVYAPFFNGENQIELLEIFPEADIDITNTTYLNLNTLSDAALNDKVVLLYLENYPKKGDLCTALDCDNQGIEQIARLRVLLISSDDAKSITAQDPIYNEHDWYEYYLALPEVAVQRDILTCANTSDYISLKRNYYQLIKDNETLADVGLGLDAILQKFGKDTISSDISTLFDLSPSAVPTDIQYRYDILKDLVDTYTEIKALLLHINVHCCPSIGSFPKHLLLGRLVESQTHYKSLRHRFYKSPIIGHEDTNLKKVHSLLNRVHYLVNNYLETEKGEEIKITPSLLQGTLGPKTIPFYYDVTVPFLDYWSYEKFQNFRQTSNLSYHTTNLSPSLPVQQPLLHTIDNYDFLRIEGIQGKSYRDALDQVLVLKEQYGLNFDVKVLSINPTTKDIDLGEYRCEFEDLNVLLKAWTTEQECILASMASFFSGFTTDKVGGNIKEIDYTQIITIPDVEIINTDIIIDEVASPRIRGDFNVNTRRSIPIEQQLRIDRKSRLPYAKNVIDESLTVEEKTIGRYMKEAIDENKKGSANDIKNAAKSKIEAFLSTDQWNEKPAIRDFVLNDAVDLLSITYILSEKVPQSISEIDTGNIDTYELTLDEVCQLVKRLKVTYQTIDLDDTLKDILGLLINQLSFVCCSGEKLAILLDEIEKRKEEIIKRLQLSEFVKKHPGLRHYAGVPVGGTFVMAYLTEDAEDKAAYQPVRMELDFLEQPNIDDDGTDGDEGRIQLWDDRISTKFAFLHKVTRGTQNPRNEIVIIGDDIEETVSNLVDFFNNIWRVAGLSKKCKATANGTKLSIEITDQSIRKRENFIQFYNPAIVNTNNKIYFDENEIITRNLTTENTVIADFALSYMCCSDCAPVNFIIPKEPVSLSLPTTFICRDEETMPIPFTVTPEDGEIKAVVDEGVSGGVIQNEEGIYLFDANQIDPSLLGTAIQFTVNDEETTAVITVYENPQPVVTVNQENFIYNDIRTEVEVFFEVTGTGLNSNSEFAWDFGDNTPITLQRPDSDGIVSHSYTIPIQPNNTVFPRLTVTNELCTEEVILEGITFQDPIEASLAIPSTYCLDVQGEASVELFFTNINPEDGLIEIVGGNPDGMFVNQDARSLVITPGLFNRFNEPIAFTISSLPTTAQITIFPILQIGIIQDPGGFFWEDGVLRRSHFFGTQLPDDVDPDTLTYEWLINEETVSTEQFFTHQFIINEDQSFQVELFVTDANGCTARATTLVSIQYPVFSISVGRDSYCTDDDESYEVTVSPNFHGTMVNGLGVTQNSNGTFSFSPIDTGITTTQDIDLGIVGTSATTTINLNSGPVPSFTVEILENRLIITNTSEAGLNPYIWNIAGEEITRQNRTGFNLDVFSFQESVIDISLTVHGECGPNTLLRENITIRGDISFTLELPDNVIDYCNNDLTPYLITITPNIPGTLVEGDGVVQNNDGSFVFIPASAGITSVGSVPLSINGQELLTVNIHQPESVSISWDPDQSITRPETMKSIQFTASPNIPGASYNWTFEDGTTATGIATSKLFTIPSEIQESFTSNVTLQVTGTVCGIVPVEETVEIIINPPNFSIEIDNGNREFCNTDPAWYLISVTPNIPGTVVEGDGVFPDESDQYFFIPSNSNVSPGSVDISINNQVLATVQVHESPGAFFSFNPPSPGVTRPNNTVSVVFTATDHENIQEKFPNAVFNWAFVDPETEQTLHERQGAIVSVPITVPQQAQGTYTITAILTISGTLCDLDPGELPVDILITEEPTDPVEPMDCNEIVSAGILADGETIVADPIPDGDIGTFIVRPTKNAYGIVIQEMGVFISGDKNGQLDEMLSSAIQATANNLLEATKPIPIQLFTKYLRVQIRLVIHILHCQKDLNESDIAVLDPVMEAIKEALNTLSNTQFDVGDPDPAKLEGTLRLFLMNCLENNDLPDYTRGHIETMIELIAPIG